MKLRWLGVLFVIFCLLFIYAEGIFVGYLVFHTGEYGRWNECFNATNTKYSFDFNQQDNGVQKLQEKIIEICGNAPTRHYENLRLLSNSLEHQILKGDIVGAEMLGFIGLDLWYLMLMFFGFIVGYFIEKLLSTTRNRVSS